MNGDVDQHTKLDFYGASSLKPQSAGTQIGSPGHIILILNQPVFALNAVCLAEEATNVHFLVFWSELKHTIYCTRGYHANHYTNDGVSL
jgi:hypothetical protein